MSKAVLISIRPKAGAMWKHYIFCEVGQFFRTALVYESKYALRALIGHPTGFGGVVIFFAVLPSSHSTETSYSDAIR